MFYAWGNGVAKGARVTGATIYDIAPTLLRLLGQDVPGDLVGRALV